MVAFLYRMPAGIPGVVSRMDQSTLVPEIITPNGTAGAPLAYGIPVVADTAAGNVGNMRAVAAADTAAVIYGFLVRPFPGYDSTNAIGVSTPNASGECTVMKRGFMTVTLSGTTAATKNGQVFVWVAASTGSHVQGGVEAVTSAGNTITLPNSYFVGPADANGITEIGFNI